jgi:tetratricopeptide (TPR) repeat protein
MDKKEAFLRPLTNLLKSLDDPVIHYLEKGIELLEANEYNDAAKVLDKAREIIESNSKSESEPYFAAEVYYALGIAYSSSGKYDDAVKAFEKAKEIIDSKSESDFALKVYYLLKIVYRNSGNEGKANEIYIQILNIKPDFTGF